MSSELSMGPDPFWSFAVAHPVQAPCHAKDFDFAGFSAGRAGQAANSAGASRSLRAI
jgi:hypothetical protein